MHKTSKRELALVLLVSILLPFVFAGTGYVFAHDLAVHDRVSTDKPYFLFRTEGEAG